MPLDETLPENTDPNIDRSGEIKALEQKWVKKNRQMETPAPADLSASTASDSELKNESP